ncbi:MAG TPA: phage tail protein [Candidatus Saccharimonadales bacterium]|nr:phage tail protein [Candidatus Saccharimonadales bacterium]
MHDADKNNFLNLNREGVWPGFTLNGLEPREDGSLQLTSLPLLTAAVPDVVKTAGAPNGPSGLAIDATGTLYFTDPAANRIMRVQGCDGCVQAVSCVGGMGSSPSRFHTPRGLLIPKNRNALFVADSENHRIQIFDLDTFQLVGIWGEIGLGLTSSPSSLPGQFNTPWTLVSDSAGYVFVLDYGNRRIQKFSPAGDVIPSFCDAVQASGLLKQPSEIAVLDRSGSLWILVLDLPPAGPPTIFAFTPDGQPVKDASGNAISFQEAHMQQPMGFAVCGDKLYVGDNALRCVLEYRFDPNFSFCGEAIGYQGPVASLLCDTKGNLWVHSGLDLAPIALREESGHAMHGVLTRDPLQVPDRSVVWHRLKALLEPLPENAHLELFAYATSDSSDKPEIHVDAANPFADARWQPVAMPGHADVTDLYIGGAQATFLWLGALFTGDGTTTPILNQLRVEFDYPAYDQYLPAVYAKSADCGEFLLRLLSLFEALFTEVEGEIASLPKLFDPNAVPKGFLAWLASSLGFDLDENWNDAKQRRLIAEIFRLYGWRGTPAGLRELLRLFAGVDAVIVEPLQQAAWWALPDAAGSCCDACADESSAAGPAWQDTGNSILGWTTMLAPAQPQGAVVGTSAVLDQSHLLTVDQFGSPLFSDVAYQFSVQVLRGQVNCAESLARIRAILDQEKPAHTVYHLCIVEPRMRVGFQCRLGVDTVVGGPGRSLSLSSDQILGEETRLAGGAESRLGAASQLGVTMRLS